MRRHAHQQLFAVCTIFNTGAFIETWLSDQLALSDGAIAACRVQMVLVSRMDWQHLQDR